MPTARAFAAAAELGGRIIVAGGDIGSGYSPSLSQMVATVDCYDPATDTWSTRPGLPRPRAAVHAAVFGGRLLVGGEEISFSGTTDEIDVYDPVANAWSVLPMPVSCGTALVTDGAALWAVSGGSLRRTSDPATAAWRSLTSNTSQPGPGPGVYLGGRIYVFAENETLRYDVANEIH